MKAKHAKIILLFWAIVVVSSIAIGSQSLLTSGVQESTQFTDESTESGKGSILRNERFNLTSDTITHVIVINLENGEDITSNEWRNFTLYLTLYLNETLFDLGYNSIISEPLVSGNPFTEELANSLISEDKRTGLIYINGEGDDFSTTIFEDVELIRGILHDPQSVYTFAQDFTGSNESTDTFPEVSKLSNVQLILTGSPATFSDTLESVEDIFSNSEVIAVIVVIIILTIVFRSPLGMIIPLLAMIASLFPTYLITFIMGELGLLQISDFIPLIIAMIGIAVAVDYNLFSLVRYREEFRKRKAKLQKEENWNKESIKLAQQESASIMNKTAGTAVMYSGFAVIIGFLSLILLGDEFGAGMSLSVTVVVILSVLTARTLTPAVLSLSGQYLDWPNITTRAKSDVTRYKDNKQPEGIWVKWSRLVMKHPLVFLVIGILTMVPFTFLSLDTNLGFDTVKNLPDGTESREGFEILNEKFNLGSLSPYTIVIDTTVENGVFTDEIIDATNQLASWALAFETTNSNGDIVSFESAESLSVTTNKSSGEPISMNLIQINSLLSQDDVFLIPDGNSSFIPVPNVEKLKFVEFSLKQNVNIDYKDANNTLLIHLTSNIDSGSTSAWDLVSVIRGKTAELFGNINNVELYVIGFSAAFADTKDALYNNVPFMLTVAIILIFITLLILFRSILLPIKAILTIGGSILFSLGAMVFIFQYGFFVDIIGAEKVEGILFFVPVFLFTIILGLGMDYTIFIISRIREEVEKGTDPSEAVGVGLSKTANVVTSAATIMISTFLVFALAPMLFLKTMGLAMAVAIFVDASVSRMIILPSAMALAGKWNWYLPESLKKILPEVKLDH